MSVSCDYNMSGYDYRGSITAGRVLNFSQYIPRIDHADSLRSGLERIIVVCMVASVWSAAHFSKSAVTLFHNGDFVTFAVTLVALSLCAWIAWRWRLGFRSVFGFQIVVVSLSIIWMTVNGSGLIPTLSFGLPAVAIGTVLVRYEKRESIFLICVGVVLSTFAYTICRTMLPFDEAGFTVISALMTLVFEGLYCITVRDLDVPNTPARENHRIHDSIAGMPVLEQRAIRWSFVFLILLYFVGYGVLETFALYLHGDNYPFSLLLLPLVVVVVAVVIAVNRFHSLMDWGSVLVYGAIIVFLGCLLVALFADALPSALFAVIYTTTVIVHLVIWATVMHLSDGNTSTAVVLFAIVTGVLYAFQMGGHLVVNILMTWFNVQMPQVSLLSSPILVGLTLFIGIFLLVQVCITNKRVIAARVGGAPSQVETGVAEPSLSEENGSWTALGESYQLSERERTVMQLYASGRTVPVISEQLHLAQPTVRTYIQRAYGKLDVRDKQELLDVVETFKGALD